MPDQFTDDYKENIERPFVEREIEKEQHEIESIPVGARLVKFGLDWGWFPDPIDDENEQN